MNSENIESLPQSLPAVSKLSITKDIPKAILAKYLALAALGILPYVNTLRNGFVYDDGFQILQNPYLVNFHHLKQIFFTLAWSFQGTQGLTNYYRPLMTFAYLLLYQAFGPLAYPYHLLNILMNAMVIVAVYLVTRELFSDEAIAFLTSAVFALHPIHTEAVAWVAAISDLQLALFVLLSFYCFLMLDSSTGKRSRRFQIWGAVFFALALLSKEPAVMLAPVAVIFEHFFRRDRAQTAPATKVARYAPYLALVLAYVAFRVFVLGAFVPKYQRPTLAWKDVFLTAVALVGQYAEKLIWPVKLTLFYLFEPVTTMRSAEFVAGFAAVLITVVLFVVLWRRERLAAFGLVWLFMILGPVLNARWMAANVFAERYLYLPSLGFCWVVAWVARAAWKKLSVPSRAPRAIAAAAGVILLSLAFGRVYARNLDWQDDLRLYESTIRAFPNADLIRANLGAAYWNSGQHAKAEEQWRIAIEITPDNVVALNDLGLARTEQGRYDEAIALFQKVIARKSHYANVRLNYGNVLAKVGRLDDAIEQIAIAVQLDPLNPGNRNALADLYFQKGNDSEAEKQYRASLEGIPSSDAYDGLVKIFEKTGRQEEILPSLQKAIDLNPWDHFAHFRLAGLMEQSGRNDEAVREYRKGLETDPNNKEARAALAKLTKH